MRNRAVIEAKRIELARADAAARVQLAVTGAVRSGVARRTVLLSVLGALGMRPSGATDDQ